MSNEFNKWLNQAKVFAKDSLFEYIEEQLQLYDLSYRNGTPEISDSFYDEIYNYLKEQNPNNRIFLKSVIKQPLKVTRKQKLAYPMMSLDKLKSLDELFDWLRSRKHVNIDEIYLMILPKYDSISLLCDELGEEAWTRGDGEYGECSTEHLRYINSERVSCNVLYDCFSIGEAIISNKNWEKHFKGKTNPRSKEPYKSARNTVAGFFNVDDPSTIKEELQYVDFLRYDLISSKIRSSICKSVRLDTLNQKSSIKVPYVRLQVSELSEASLSELYKLWSVDYQIDGLVINLDGYLGNQFNPSTWEDTLGSEKNGNPAWSCAYKHPSFSSSKVTTINELEKTVSKQGDVKPVCLIDTINLVGADVSRVTGINMNYILDWCLFPGEEILVSRSGDVIPKIIEVGGIRVPFRYEFKSEKDYHQAYKLNSTLRKLNYAHLHNYSNLDQFTKLEYHLCPSCKSNLTWDNTHTELVCSNPECKQKLVSQLVSFFQILDIEEFGEPSIQRLIDNGFDTYQSILNITKSKFLSIEGFGEISVEKILSQFEKLKTEGVSFSKLGHALGYFENLGEKTLQLIVDNIPNIHHTLYAPTQQLILIKGVSLITANSFSLGLKKMLESGSGWPVKISHYYTPTSTEIRGVLSEKEFCFTKFRNKDLESQILSLGGRLSDDIKKTTTHLIVKDLSLSSSKVVKAKKMSTVEIWDETILINFLNKMV